MDYKKTGKMAQFYEECQKKGYTDMHDDVQSLKAKVIATDLGLKYKNIVSFYEEARTCYDIVQKELAESRREAEIKKQKDAEEKARRAVNGELLLELSDSENANSDEKIISVYMRPDKTVYCKVNHGNKIEGAPAITVKKGGAVMYTYHPSQAVYTGATVGGVTTGGVHYTKESYSTNVHQAGKGYIDVEAGGTNITVDRIIIPNHTRELFKRDNAFRNIAKTNEIKCYQHTAALDMYLQSLSLPTLDATTRMNAMGMVVDERRISYRECVDIANLVGRIIHGDFPPSDEEIYNKACALAESDTSTKLAEAKQLFNSISDYNDAASQARKVSKKYDEVLQHEKEQAILKKEATQAKTQKTVKIALIIIAIFVVVGFVSLIVSNLKKNDLKYNNGLALIEAGEYDEAAAVFSSLRGYKDSKDQLLLIEEKVAEKMIEDKYNHAISLMKSGISKKENEAYHILLELDDYKDAKDLLNDFKYEIICETAKGGGGYEWPYEYDNKGLLTRVNNQNGEFTLYSYDENNRLVKTNRGNRIQTEYWYNDDGTLQKTKYLQANGQQSSYCSTAQYNSWGYPEYIDLYRYSDEWNFIYDLNDDGSINSIKCTTQKYNSNIVSLLDFSAHDGRVVLDYKPNYEYVEVNFISKDGKQITRYQIRLLSDTFELRESGKSVLDDYGAEIFRTEKWAGGIREYSFEYERDESGNITKKTRTLKGDNSKVEYSYDYGYIYCPDAN